MLRLKYDRRCYSKPFGSRPCPNSPNGSEALPCPTALLIWMSLLGVATWHHTPAYEAVGAVIRSHKCLCVKFQYSQKAHYERNMNLTCRMNYAMLELKCHLAPMSTMHICNLASYLTKNSII